MDKITSDESSRALYVPDLILVIDDDAALNNLIRRTLERHKYRTDFALNGKDAIQKALESRNLLILLDYRLPDMKGVDLINSLAGDDIYPPFIVMTGHGDEKISVQLMKMGARDYIIKGSGFTDMLPHVVDRTFREIEKEKRLEAADIKLKERMEELESFYQMSVGREVKMKQLKEEIVLLKEELDKYKDGSQ